MQILMRRGGSWQIASVTGGTDVLAEEMAPIPPSWLVISATWGRSCRQSQCAEARLASWDGVEIIISSMRRENREGIWTVHPLFKVHPATGYLCSASLTACDME